MFAGSFGSQSLSSDATTTTTCSDLVTYNSYSTADNHPYSNFKPIRPRFKPPLPPTSPLTLRSDAPPVPTSIKPNYKQIAISPSK